MFLIHPLLIGCGCVSHVTDGGEPSDVIRLASQVQIKKDVICHVRRLCQVLQVRLLIEKELCLMRHTFVVCQVGHSPDA